LNEDHSGGPKEPSEGLVSVVSIGHGETERNGRNDDPTSPKRTVRPVVIRLRWPAALVLFGIAAAYVVSVTVLVAPPSPARNRLLPVVERVSRPYLNQTWMLYAPTPATSSRDWLVSVQVRTAAGIQESPESNATKALIALAKSRRWAPSRMMSVAGALDDLTSAYVHDKQVIENRPWAEEKKRLATARVDAGFSRTQADIVRFGSWYGRQEFPSADIIAVRARLVDFPDANFSARFHPRPSPGTLIWSGGWTAYLPAAAA
jgi:Family of unknown function (DUF5819)